MTVVVCVGGGGGGVALVWIIELAVLFICDYI